MRFPGIKSILKQHEIERVYAVCEDMASESQTIADLLSRSKDEVRAIAADAIPFPANADIAARARNVLASLRL